MAHVTPLKEVTQKLEDGETLCLQLAVYHYDDDTQDTRFRFIRKTKDGKLKAQRGQAGIPSLRLIIDLAEKMKKICKDEMKLMAEMLV